MKQTPQLYTPESLDKWDVSVNIGETIKGNWVKARPLSINSLSKRIKLSWGVFTGKYDALHWNGQ